MYSLTAGMIHLNPVVGKSISRQFN